VAVVDPLGAPFDAYAVLGVSMLASADEIRHAYRGLAHRLHPDANPNDPATAARFAQVSAAYELLRDDAKRRAYDLQRAALSGPRASRAAPGPTGNTQVRGPGARPSHHHHDGPGGVARELREADELAVLRWFLRIAAVALILFLIAVTLLALHPAPPCGSVNELPCRMTTETPATAGR
jgi:curved DNA-binding protein CbpA